MTNLQNGALISTRLFQSGAMLSQNFSRSRLDFERLRPAPEKGKGGAEDPTINSLQ